MMYVKHLEQSILHFHNLVYQKWLTITAQPGLNDWRKMLTEYSENEQMAPIIGAL